MVCERWNVRSSDTLHFGFNSGDVRDKNLSDRDVVTTPPFIGPFCMSAGAQSAAQSMAFVLLFLLRRAPRTLDGGPSERQHFLVKVGREDSEWG